MGVTKIIANIAATVVNFFNFLPAFAKPLLSTFLRPRSARPVVYLLRSSSEISCTGTDVPYPKILTSEEDEKNFRKLALDGLRGDSLLRRLRPRGVYRG